MCPCLAHSCLAPATPSSHPRCLWKRAGARPLPLPLSTACPQASKARPGPGGEEAPALPHMPQRGDVQPLPLSQPSLSPQHPGGRDLHVCAMPIMCLPLSCVPTGNSLPLEYLTVRSMRKSAVSSLCLGTRCGYDEE